MTGRAGARTPLGEGSTSCSGLESDCQYIGTVHSFWENANEGNIIINITVRIWECLKIVFMSYRFFAKLGRLVRIFIKTKTEKRRNFIRLFSVFNMRESNYLLLESYIVSVFYAHYYLGITFTKIFKIESKGMLLDKSKNVTTCGLLKQANHPVNDFDALFFPKSPYA